MAARNRQAKAPAEQPRIVPFEDEDAGMPPRDLHDVPAQDLRPRATDWLVPDRLEWGTIALLQGSKGSGKSTWLRAIAAHVTGGPRLAIVGGRRKLLGSVLWYAGEEGLETRVRPGLEAAGANLARVYCADALQTERQDRLALPADCERLTRRIRQRCAVLVVLDPLFAFSDGSCDLEGPSEPARHWMTELGRVATATGALVILSRNLTKDTSRGALAAGRGSGEIAHFARSVLHAQEIPGEPGRYALAVASCNAGRPCPAIVYELEDRAGVPVVRGRGETQATADDLAAGVQGEQERYLVELAKALIRRLLPEGRTDSKVVRAKAEAAMIGTRTLQTAARQLGVRYEREGSRESTVCYWLPPRGGW